MPAPVFSRFFGLLLLLLLTVGRASGTHIVGGELDLQHEQDSHYTLTLNLYFDDINGNTTAMDGVLTATIFDKATNAVMTTISMPRLGNTFVAYTNPACAVGTLRTRKLVYATDIVLNGSVYDNPTGYYVAVERCCRNGTISNIRNPDDAGQTFYLEFPAVQRQGQPFLDSTPRIFPPLSDYACRGDLFYYDFGGTDADGDSLVYDMVTPLNGHSSSQAVAPTQLPAPYAPIVWNAGRSTANQIPGTPPLGIDAHTGRLTVQPSAIGLFVFGVRCSEYRAGQKIGETRRDFQLYVLNCPRNAAPTMRVTAGYGNTTYRAGLDTLRLRLGSDHCLRIRTTDPDPNTKLTVTTRPVNYAGLTTTFSTSSSATIRAAGQPDTLQTTLCFPDCADTQGRVYLLDVIVADDGCSLPRRDTLRIAFTAETGNNSPPVLSSSFPPASGGTDSITVHLRLGQTYTATLHGRDADPNPLTLTATGEGFDLTAAGMGLAAQNGVSQATGTFSWQPTCQSLPSAAGLPVRFRLAESGVCQPQPQELLVRFYLIVPRDSVVFAAPNIITPNADGLNDYFQATDLPVDVCSGRFASVRIFNRWGRQVYESAERGFRWGGLGLAGTYYYLISYTDGRRYKGWLDVMP